MTDLDDALVRAGRYLRRGAVSADLRTLEKTGGREADSFYRDRWSYDKVVRSTHGVNCTGSCSWKVYVKDGIITWEAQQTDYPSAGPDRPDYEPRGCPRGPRSPGTRTRPPGSGTPTSAACCWRSSGRPRPATTVTRSPRGPRSPAIPRSRGGTRRPAGPAASCGRAGTRRSSSRRPRTCTRSAPGPGPDRRLQPDPGDEHGQPRGRRPVPHPHRGAAAVVLRLVRRPAGGLPAGLRGPDRRARVRGLVGRLLPCAVGLERAGDPHSGRTLDDRGPLPRAEGRGLLAGLLRRGQVRRRVALPRARHGRRAGHGHGTRDPARVPPRPPGALLRRLPDPVHRRAVSCGPRAGARGIPPWQVPDRRRAGRHHRARRLQARRAGRPDRAAGRARRVARVPVRRGGSGPVEPGPR
jgi:hypothetical protein